MITSPVQHHDENDDEDLDMLRKIAMESLKRGSQKNEFSQEHQFQNNVQPVFPNQPEMIPYENNEVPFQNGPFPALTNRPLRLPGPSHYMRPRFNNFGPRHPVRPFIQRGMPHHFPPQPVIPDFVPIPHVNPQFLSQQPPIQPQIFQPVNEFPMEYIPTPTVRLSPRSAEFIAANEQAMKKASSKRYSRSPPSRRRRSRSISPIRRRSRSKSPYKRRSPNENVRKRFRSKSPENRAYKSRNNSPKVDKRSKSPQNRSQSPRNARFSRRGRDFNNRYNNNNNGSNGNGRYNRKRSESDKEDEKPEQNRSQSKPKEESVKVKEIDSKEKIDDKKEIKEKSLTPEPEEKSTTPPILPTKKEKTEQELEDELLASTDEEDGDQLDINMDDNELDFLEDDSESENEGRFKSKPSENVKKASILPTKHSYGNSKSYDRNKYSSSSSSRYDYKRDDKYSHSRRRDHAGRKNSPDLDSRRKSPTERKPITLNNKDKDDVKSSNESERKPMFKSTFKSVESGEKKSESTATKKSDSRPALVRSYVNKPDVVVDKKSSSVKSVITLSEDSSKTGSKKKIMERLGEFVGAKGKNEGNRSRTASKQVDERRKVIYRMNSTVQVKSVASRISYIST